METKDADSENLTPQVRVTVTVQNRYALDEEVATGRQIKETARIPMDFALYRRVRGGNEPISDDTTVGLRNGDHFFARSPSNVVETMARPGSGVSGSPPGSTPPSGSRAHRVAREVRRPEFGGRGGS